LFTGIITHVSIVAATLSGSKWGYISHRSIPTLLKKRLSFVRLWLVCYFGQINHGHIGQFHR